MSFVLVTGNQLEKQSKYKQFCMIHILDTFVENCMISLGYLSLSL